ncbi:MAG: PspA/IM30 family protein [Capsulimonadales bacterium]|nr:PspA/IM30 family protein [Capsulimonadales bacterium]
MSGSWKTIKRRLRQMLGTQKGNGLHHEDPEMLLQRVQAEMRATHARNRERAVQAITMKNNLELMVRDTQKTIEGLRARANAAELRGEAHLAEKIREEVTAYECTLVRTRAEYEQAVEMAEQVKAAIRREEEHLRRKTAEALALQAQWRTLEVERSLAQLMTEISVGQDLRGTALHRQEISERHRRNRAAMVQAIVAKNNLLRMVNESEQRVAGLREKAEVARERGQEELERFLLREMEMYEANLAGAQTALHRAEAVAERAKALVHQEEVWMRENAIPFPTPTLEVAEDGDGAEDARQERQDRRLRWWLAVAILLFFLLLALSLVLT